MIRNVSMKYNEGRQGEARPSQGKRHGFGTAREQQVLEHRGSREHEGVEEAHAWVGRHGRYAGKPHDDDQQEDGVGSQTLESAAQGEGTCEEREHGDAKADAAKQDERQGDLGAV